MIQNNKEPTAGPSPRDAYDVIVIGAGLAGLSLARHLQLTTDLRVLLLDKRTAIPPARQKLGESTVQVAGYYFSKVLGMEQHLLHEHFMKYNLRMHWKSDGRNNDIFEDYSQAYIRSFSNIPAFQIDRNVFEKELLRLNESSPHFSTAFGISNLQVDLAQTGRHSVRYSQGKEERMVEADWLIDTTGRGRFLTRKLKSHQNNPIQHGSSFMWVEGLIDVEKLTSSSMRDYRLNKNRRATGHLPYWLATNHFMGEGFWVWVIPLRGKTSLGVVYDNKLFPRNQVSSGEKLRDWLCKEFPLFSRDLPEREIIEFSAMKNFSYGCKETINPGKWAISGEASRFTDPLYSPGCDFIALHNSLIVDAILTRNPRELQRKCWLSEMVMQSLYGSLLPTYSASYDALGDQETFVLKYSWELSVYFAFFVFPFINDLATDAAFVPAYLSRFSRLGLLNEKLQAFLSNYYQWKKRNCTTPQNEPLFHDYTQLEPLRRAEETFYKVGVTATEAKEVLDDQLVNLKELACFIVAYVYSIVLNDESILTNRSFVESINFKELEFAPDKVLPASKLQAGSEEPFTCTFDPHVFRHFRHAGETQAVPDAAQMNGHDAAIPKSGIPSSNRKVAP